MTSISDNNGRTSSAKKSAPSSAQHGSAPGGEKLRGTVVIGAAPPEDRKEVLRKMIANTQAAIKKAPPGSLIIRHPKHAKGGVQYYQRIPGKPAVEIYIPASDTAKIRALAQKDYDRKALTLMKKQLNGMVKYNKPCYPGSLDEVFYALSAERQKLVTPAELTTKQYAELWLNTPYEKSRFEIDPNRPNYTELGELVRSKSEVLIANALHRAGLLYKYECPLTLNGKTIRPDFTILDPRTRREVYFEHCGIMDDPEYISAFLWKLDLYESADIFQGDGLLFTFESGGKSLNTRNLNKLIRHRFFS